jgi:uncharacterized Fe-S cluster-containing radical SAM superfamily protein
MLVGTDPNSKFYRPKEVPSRLLEICKTKHLRRIRISGSEPTIGRAHLLEILEHLSDDGFADKGVFILETNGILIGHDRSYALDFARYPFVHARVSIKCCTPESFSMFTGSNPSGFELQIRALQHLFEAGVSCHPAVFAAFNTKVELSSLARRITQINESLARRLEVEDYVPYREAKRRMKRMGYPDAMALQHRSVKQSIVLQRI